MTQKTWVVESCAAGTSYLSAITPDLYYCIHFKMGTVVSLQESLREHECENNFINYRALHKGQVNAHWLEGKARPCPANGREGLPRVRVSCTKKDAMGAQRGE